MSFTDIARRLIKSHPFGGLMVEIGESISEYRKKVEKEAEVATKCMAGVGAGIGMAFASIPMVIAGANPWAALAMSVTGLTGAFIAWKRFEEARRRIDENLDLIGKAKKAADEAKANLARKAEEAKASMSEKATAVGDSASKIADAAQESLVKARSAIKDFFKSKKTVEEVKSKETETKE